MTRFLELVVDWPKLLIALVVGLTMAARPYFVCGSKG